MAESEWDRPSYGVSLFANDLALQDVIFAAGGNPVKKEKTMPHNIPIDEARRILGLSANTSIGEMLEHDAKMLA